MMKKGQNYRFPFDLQHNKYYVVLSGGALDQGGSMTKYKSKLKENRLFVTAKISKENEINIHETEFLSKNYIRGILSPKLKGKRRLVYSGPSATPLFSYLTRPITKHEFFLITEQLIDVARRVRKKKLFPNKIVFDMTCIFINEATKELQFLYLPLSTVSAAPDMTAFLRNLTYSVTPAAERDTEYLSRFLFFLNGMQEYEAARIEQFIGSEDRTVIDIIKKPNCQESEKITDKPFDGHEINVDDDEGTAQLIEEDDGTVRLEEEDDTTGLLTEEDDDATGLLDAPPINYPSLYRVLTDENISINKPVFRLGKEKSYVDYFVQNNNAVSRSHADIITRGTKYYIIDLNSKNRTWVNGQFIPPQYEIEIFNNDRIKLANEEFIFTV